jgi:hypothetical protein
MRVASLVAAAAFGLTAATSALAGWTAAAAGGGAATAATLPDGPTPAATVPPLSMTVTVSWSASPLATGYVLTRRNTVGVATAPGGTCGGVVTGTTCVETVTTGTYRYTVAVRRNGWTGREGASSAPVVAPGV